MTGRWAIAAVAFILAACSAPTIPVVPSSASDLPPVATPRPTFVPVSFRPSAPACPEALEPGMIATGDVEVETIRGWTDVHITATGFQRPGGPHIVVPDPESAPAEAQTLIGGRDLRLEYRPDSSADDTAAGPFETLAVGLDAGSGPVAWSTRSDATGAVVSVPDQEMTGVMEIGLTWSDACFTYSGIARLAVDIVPSTIADACRDPKPQDEVFGSQDVPVELGGARTRLSTTSWQARYSAAGGSDNVPQFAGYDPAADGARARAGSSEPLRILDRGFDQTGAFLRVWRQDDIDFDDGWPSPTEDPVVETALEPGPDGVVRVPFPGRAGRYVFDMTVDWERPCVSGQAYLYFPVTAT